MFSSTINLVMTNATPTKPLNGEIMKNMTIAFILSALTLSQTFASTTKVEAYKVDTKASQITWTGSKATGSSHSGNLSVKEGSLDVAGTELKGGSFTVDMNTLTNTDLASNPEYQAKLVGHLKSDDFFKVAQHPDSKLKVTSITKKAEGEVLVKGELTLLGTTKPVEFPAKVAVTKDSLSADGTMKLNRTNWGLKYGSKSFFKELVADKIIKDEFELAFKIVAKK
jgi:polyisoprenoid-binding protein YceI